MSLDNILAPLAAAAVALSSQGAAAAELGALDLYGFIGVESRVFPWAPRHEGQEGHGEVSLILNPNLRYRSSDGRHLFIVSPFYRLDSRDKRRTHFDLHEVYWHYSGGNWEILAGFNRVSWSVTKSRRLVDIINQIDLVEDFDGEDTLGQPTLNLKILQDWGQVDLYFLPGFRERTFPGNGGRLRAPIPIEVGNPIYTSNLGNKHVDVALRYSLLSDDLDLGLYYFHGTGREPTLIPNADSSALLPRYDIIKQAGLNLEYRWDAWVFRFEGIVREGQGKTFGAFVAGFKYNLLQFPGAVELGLLAEYLYDGRDATAPGTPLEHDIFAGIKLKLGDIQNTSLLMGVIVDPSSGESFIAFEAKRRLGEHLALELQARFVTGTKLGEKLYSISRDGYIQFRLSHYF